MFIELRGVTKVRKHFFVNAYPFSFSLRNSEKVELIHILENVSYLFKKSPVSKDRFPVNLCLPDAAGAVFTKLASAFWQKNIFVPQI